MKLGIKEKFEAESIEKRIQRIKRKQYQMIGVIVVLICMGIGSFSSKSKIVEKMNLFLSLPTESELSNIVELSNGEETTRNEEIQDIPIPIETQDKQLFTLNALSACLMDASNGRVLYAKDAYKEMPMASTTKIMTLLVVLENAKLDEIVTVSKNAACQPDVQLNINTGEQYVLGDLLYSLMLESHNDTAVAIAEHVGGSVDEFCDMMTKRAKELGAEHTQFKTPNGLDADGHYTTARDLSLIASYAITNKEFCKIIKTQTYQFDSIDKKRSFTVNNKNRFLYMMEGALGIKTGYTGKAGYCFVGAINSNGKTLVSTVLGSGWPPRKELKWTDTRKLMNYGLDNYEVSFLFNHIQQDEIVEIPRTLPVFEGKTTTVKIRPESDIRNEKMLMREDETVTMQLSLDDYIIAPCKEGTFVGNLTYFINGEVYQSIPIVTTEEVQDYDFWFLFRKLMTIW